MSAQPPANPETHEAPAAVAATTDLPAPANRDRTRALVLTGFRAIARVVVVTVLSAGLLVALVAGGLFFAPTIGVAATATTSSPPRRPPIVPPAVPLGAREDWAVWSYVDKINQAWGKDWPLVIQWFEDLDRRYPGNSMVLDKLYVAYLEDGRARQMRGDLAGARQRYEQAARYDPNRGVAQDFLAELNKAQDTRR